MVKIFLLLKIFFLQLLKILSIRFNLICIQKSIKYRMAEDFQNALLQARLISFTNQIFETQLTINKMQMELMRKCEGKSRNIQSHGDIIKICRKGTDRCDVIIKDVRDYFSQLKIYPAYELFQSIFRLYTYFIKTISEAYLYRFQFVPKKTLKVIKTQDSEEDEQPKQKNICSCMLKKKNSKLEIEKLDYELALMEKKQMLLLSQMQKISGNITFDKQKIESINCDKKNESFKQLETTFHEISQKVEYVLNAYFKANEVQSRNLSSIIKGQHLQAQISQEFNQSIKQILPGCLQKVVKIVFDYLRSIKRKQHKKSEVKIIQPQLSRKNTLVSKQQKNEPQDKLIQMEKAFKDQIRQLTKQNQSIAKQCEKIREKIQEYQHKEKQYIGNYEELEKIYKKRTFQLEQTKAELSWSMKLNEMSKRSSLVKKKKTSIRQLKNKQQLQKSVQTQAPLKQSNQVYTLYNSPEKNKLTSWMNKKKNKAQRSSMNSSSDEFFNIQKLVQGMNQYLKLQTHRSPMLNKQEINIDEIIIKWKKGINEKIVSSKSIKNEAQNKSSDKKNQNKKNKRKSKVDARIKKHIQKNKSEEKLKTKEMGVQVLLLKQVEKRNVIPETRKVLTFRARAQKTQSQANQNKLLKKGTYQSGLQSIMNYRKSMDQLYDVENQAKSKLVHEKKILQQSGNNKMIKYIGPEAAEQNQLDFGCFQGFNLSSMDLNCKIDKISKFKQYISDKQKKQKQNSKKQAIENKWRESHQHKINRQENTHSSFLMRFDSLDFTIWSTKIDEFIKNTKQTDPKKYQRLVYDFLIHIRDKMHHKLVESSYKKYLSSCETIESLQTKL